MNKKDKYFLYEVKNKMNLSFAFRECRDILEDLRELSDEQSLHDTYGSSRSFVMTLKDSLNNSKYTLRKSANIILILLMTGGIILSFPGNSIHINSEIIVYLLMVLYLFGLKDFLFAGIYTPNKSEKRFAVLFQISSLILGLICIFFTNLYYPKSVHSFSADYTLLGIALTRFYVSSLIICVVICLITIFIYIYDREILMSGVFFQLFSLAVSLFTWYRNWANLEDFSYIPKLNYSSWVICLVFSVVWYILFNKVKGKRK